MLRFLAPGVMVAGLCGCASQEPAKAVVASEPSLVAKVARAAQSLRGSTSDDVIAALGPATVVRFDSGYEIWVYRFVEPVQGKLAPKTDRAAAAREKTEPERPLSELVMLVTPSRIVAKVRVRSPSESSR